jgi:phosphocarrier protein HPr
MGGQSVVRTVTLGSDGGGLHLVPCSRLVKLANGLTCNVSVRKGTIHADAKNILDLMVLAAGPGESLELMTSGDGAEEAMARLVRLFETNFAE